MNRANSASASSGMTMSSFSLKAFVRRAIAPSRLRSAQKRLASAGSLASKSSVFGCGWRIASHAVDAARDLAVGVPGDVDEQHGLRRLGAARLHLVVDGPNILLVEVLERHQRLRAASGKGKALRELEDHATRFAHVGPEELQADRALGFVPG